MSDEEAQKPLTELLAPSSIRLDATATDRDDAIRQAGAALIEAGAVDPSYVDAMLERENSVSTFVGEGVAIPHGTLAGKDAVKDDAIVVLRFPDGVDWDGNPVTRRGGHRRKGQWPHRPAVAAGDRPARPRQGGRPARAPPRPTRSTNCSPPTRTTSSRRVKAATFYAPGDIRLEQIAEPDVAPGEVKLRVRACSTCGTDVKISRSGHPNMTAAAGDGS